MKFRYFIWYFHTVIRAYTNSDELFVINSAYLGKFIYLCKNATCAWNCFISIRYPKEYYEISIFNLFSIFYLILFIWYFHTVRVYSNSDELFVINSAYLGKFIYLCKNATCVWNCFISIRYSKEYYEISIFYLIFSHCDTSLHQQRWTIRDKQCIYLGKFICSCKNATCVWNCFT